MKKAQLFKGIFIFMFMFISCVALANEADQKALKNALQLMSEKWQQVRNDGFTDAKAAAIIMASYDNDKAALTKEEIYPASLKADLAATKQQQLLFEAYLDKTKKTLNGELQGWVKSATMMAKRWDMVSQQSLQAGTNVPQGMIDIYKKSTNISKMKKKADMYTALIGKGTPKTKELQKQIDYIVQVGVKMGAIDSAVTPRDIYSGTDKAALSKQIKEAWLSQYPKDEILGIRFIDERWIRRTEKRFNNTSGWYSLDISSLEVRVVTKQDKHIAAIFSLNLIKDHLKGDALEFDVKATKENAGLKSQMLIKNYKP